MKFTIVKNRTKAPRATWKDEERLIFKINNSWKSEVNSFIKCVTSKAPIPIGTSNDALIIMRTIDKIYKDGNNYDERKFLKNIVPIFSPA